MLKYPPEEEFGNIEYKLTLVNKSADRIVSLASQMRMRIDEGCGEAIYVIGVTDDGEIMGVNDEDFTESFNNLSIVADKNDYSMTMLASKNIKSKDSIKRKVYELLIRERNTKKYIDIKVAVAGNVDSGKSSLLGVLTSGKNDDGRGSARLSIFNFKHEVSSGRTSSIAHHILGFDDKGQVMNYSGTHKKGWPEIVKDSAKVISFYDLCGHEKYLRTTILGLTSSSPDLCLILVGANMGMTRMTHEHIFLCVSLNIPFAIVLTKIDICVNRKNIMKDTMNSINKLLKMPGLRRIPYKVSNLEDVIICAKNIRTESVVPVFPVSNVTGNGIGFVKQFLNLLGKVQSNVKEGVKDVELHIDTTFSVPGVGTVIGGQLISGNIKVGDKLLLGPNDGLYREVHVRSIQCKRVPVQEVNYGSYVCLGLKKIDRKTIRRGNVVISKCSNPIVVREFDADITVLKSHSTTIKVGYQPIIHSGTMRQSAIVMSITNKVNSRDGDDTSDCILRTGDKATVRFRFSFHPEYIKPCSRVLIVDGKCKIIGVVK
jgi:GTPase